MRAEIEKITQVLEEEGRPFTPEEVRRVVSESGVEVRGEAIDELVQEVLEEGTKRTLAVLYKAQELLGVPQHPKAESLLRDGGFVHMRFAKDGRGYDYEVGVRLGDKTGKILAYDLFSAPRGFYSPEEFDLRFESGLVTTTALSGTVVGKSWAFFKGHDSEKLEDVIETVHVLRPVLNAMGISDIESALEELSYLESEEVQLENGYIMAKDEEFWFLKRGAILGNPTLDRALIAGETVALSFPEDVEVAFQVFLDDTWADTGHLHIARTRIRWGEEAFNIRGRRAPCPTLDKESLAKAIQEVVRGEVEDLESGARLHLLNLSPQMLTFLKAFARHEHPFHALAEGRFAPHVKAEFFLDM